MIPLKSLALALRAQLFMSSKTEYGGGKAMRGGVPICWPQFSDRGPGKRHGIVRASDRWVVTRTATEPVPCVELCYSDAGFKLFYLVSLDGARACALAVPPRMSQQGRASGRSGATREWRRLRCAGPDSCTTTLTALNTAGEPLDFTGALHTYLRVSSAVGATVRGLQGVSYEDNCEAMGGKLGEQEDAEVLVTGATAR